MGAHGRDAYIAQRANHYAGYQHGRDCGPTCSAKFGGHHGGAHTAVSLDTRHIRVEMAFWHPDAIRGRARRYNVSSEAAHRFERGVDYSDTTEQLEYLTRLILDICGGQAGPINDQI